MSEVKKPESATPVSLNTVSTGNPRNQTSAEESPHNMLGLDIDSLIPEELRKAVEEEEKLHVPALASEQKTQGKVVNNDSDKDEDEPKSQVSSDISPESVDEEFLIDPESVDKFLEGELDAVASKKKDVHDEDAKPFWHDDPEYKRLYKKISYTGVKQDEFDNVLQAISDKRLVDNSKYTKGLEDESNELKNKVSLYEQEFARLKEIERNAYFDSHPETMEKYRAPMLQEAKEIKNLLDMEGVEVPLEKIVFSKTKTELTKQLRDFDIDETTLTQITNHWKSYRDLNLRYTTDREEAKNSLKEKLSPAVPEEILKKVFTNKLVDIAKTDPRFSYLKTAIEEGMDKHPVAADTIVQGNNNFKNILKAVGNPMDYIHSEKWLSALAAYTLDAAHKQQVEKQYVTLRESNEKLVENFKKVVVAYKQLASSGQGISGKRGGVPIYRNGKDHNVSSVEKDKDNFEAFLKNEIDIKTLLG